MTTSKRMNSPMPLGTAEQHRIAEILREKAGMRLLSSQAAMLQSRLSRRLRETGIKNFESYVAFVQTDEGSDELRAMISTMTTNFTQFYRERHHFTFFRNTILPPLIEAARQGQSIRMWSAGSSSGQEAYSMAMEIADVAPDFSQCDIRVLATDINSKMVSIGQEGVYSSDTVTPIPEILRKKFLIPEVSGFRISAEIRNMVSFREHNLCDEWPMRKLFNVIFCRNVAIYFEARAQIQLWKRLQERLAPGGWLFVGHSERIPSFEGFRLEPVALTTYQLSAQSTYN